MDYIEVIDYQSEEKDKEKEIDFSSFYADYDYGSSSENNEDPEEDYEEDEYETMNVKQLLRIRDYYDYVSKVDIPKSKKHTKKNEVIEYIMEFESNISNIDAVIRRHQLWKYIDELKADKYMKQFIFWS